MNSSQASNLLAFPDKRQLAVPRALDQARPSFAKVGQQLRNQLQTSLEVSELMGMFFSSSQQLVDYQGLSFRYPLQNLHLELGEINHAFRMDYHLELSGEFLGILSVHYKRELDEHELVSLETLTPALVFPLRNALKYHAAVFAAQHDPLTGVRNRASMDELLLRDLQAARRMNSPLSVLMLDIDHFKSINDNYGHAGGDAALIAVARQLQEKLRTVDAIFRFGGEEFLVVLPNTDVPYVLYIAERLRKAIANLLVMHDGERINVKASFGAALADQHESPDRLLQRADYALYQAKQQGRNQVCLAI